MTRQRDDTARALGLGAGWAGFAKGRIPVCRSRFLWTLSPNKDELAGGTFHTDALLAPGEGPAHKKLHVGSEFDRTVVCGQLQPSANWDGDSGRESAFKRRRIICSRGRKRIPRRDFEAVKYCGSVGLLGFLVRKYYQKIAFPLEQKPGNRFCRISRPWKSHI